MLLCPGPDRATRKPHFAMPPGATDCHAHVFGPSARYPFAEGRNYTPEDCTIADYLALLDTLGISRGVIVQGGAHGTDNRVTLDAIAVDRRRLRGIAVIVPGLGERALRRLDEAGIRGVRLSTVVTAGATFESLEPLAREIDGLDWHMLLHFGHSNEMLDVEPVLKRLSKSFVLDHLGRLQGDEGLNSPSYQCLLRLLDTGRCWIKLASLYRLSLEPYPHRDMLPMIHDVVARRPDRMLWGSNWPHPICPVPMPNDADIVDLLPLWIPDETVRTQVLVTNPERLYGFPRWRV